MIVVSSYKRDFWTAAGVIVVALLLELPLHQSDYNEIMVAIVMSLILFMITARKFIALENELIITGSVYWFRAKRRIQYMDLEELRCHFTGRVVNELKFRLKNGKKISIAHTMRRKRLQPLLLLLYKKGVLVIIHDVDNDDLLKGENFSS